MALEEVNKKAVLNSIRDTIQRAKAAGLLEDDISRCLLLFQEQEKMKSAAEHKKSLQRISYLFYQFLVILVWVVYRVVPVTLILAASCMYPAYHWYIDSPCLLPQHSLVEIPVTELFAMPIINCSFCQGFTRIPVINSSDITPVEFMEKYAFSAQPLLIKGAASSWPAMEKFSYSYFKDLYLQRPEALEEDGDNGQFFMYSSGIRNLGEFLNLSSDDVTKKWYIGWSSNDEFIGSQLKKHVKDPPFLPPSSSDLIAWIFMGSPGPGASLHIDFVGNPSWQAQLSGTKTWTLVPPPECEHCCQSHNITVHRGDIIVVDTNVWFHSTYIHHGNMSITFGTEYM